MVVRALGHFNMRTADEWRDYFVAPQVFKLGYRPPTLADVAPGPIVLARINQGRWLADCPFCNGAELVDPAIGLFFCLSCGMPQAGSRFLSVRFPKKADMAQIEALLDMRPDAHNRNWETSETVADLRAENRAHGIATGLGGG